MRSVTRRAVLGAGLLAGGALAWSQARIRPEGGQWIDLNGDRQWLGVRGGGGPVLLLLHGGPGASETALFRHFNRGLEASARVACWDQRGAGRSFDPASPPASLTVAQHVADCAALIRHLKERFGAPVVLLGHSWGSMLGLLTIRAHPGLVAGFIGTGQVADQGAQELVSYRFALEAAERRNEARALAELRAIGPPPYEVDRLMVKNRWVEAFGGAFAPGFGKFGAAAGPIASGEVTIAEIIRIIRANDHALRLMWPEVREMDLTRLVPRVETPVAFLLGRLDRQCPSALAADYFDALVAPDKHLVWFERSAHNPPFEEPGRFDETVAGLLRRWGLA